MVGGLVVAEESSFFYSSVPLARGFFEGELEFVYLNANLEGELEFVYIQIQIFNFNISISIKYIFNNLLDKSLIWESNKFRTTLNVNMSCASLMVLLVYFLILIFCIHN